ncbi:MAG: hypothetical protein IPN79_00505 [Saprospiraceae bacterium]|nr:hypothetical protein [Saprospiraceae bacterium]
MNWLANIINKTSRKINKPPTTVRKYGKGHAQTFTLSCFELKKYCLYQSTPNCHVMLGEDKHHYSVPYQYTGKKVEIGYTSQSVEIYYKYKRIAVHQRTRVQFGILPTNLTCIPGTGIIIIGARNIL